MNNGKRYPFSLKQLVRRLRQGGKTHREISKICSVSLGSTHLWTTGITITKEQKEAIERRRNKPLMTPARKEKLQKNAGRYLKREFNMYREYKNMFADFLVGNMRIEYFGLAGVNSEYDQNIKKKRLESKKNNYRLLEIYPSVIFVPGFKKFFLKNLQRWISNIYS